MKKRGAPSLKRYDDEIEKLLNIINAYDISDADIIRRYRMHKNDSPNTIRNKLKLMHGCMPAQFKALKNAVMEEKRIRDQKLQSAMV